MVGAEEDAVDLEPEVGVLLEDGCEGGVDGVASDGGLAADVKLESAVGRVERGNRVGVAGRPSREVGLRDLVDVERRNGVPFGSEEGEASNIQIVCIDVNFRLKGVGVEGADDVFCFNRITRERRWSYFESHA